MKRLGCLLSLVLFANVCASDFTVDENLLVKEAAGEVVCLLNEIRPQLEQPENLELKELFDGALKSIKGVSKRKPKEHDRRALKKAIEKLNDCLIEKENEDLINSIIDEDGNLTKSFPSKAELLEKMQKFNAALYAILLDGKKLNETKLDDLLDLIYHRPKEFASEHKKGLLITSAVVAAIILAYVVYKYKKAEGTSGTETPNPVTGTLEEDARFEGLNLEDLQITKKSQNALRTAGINSVGDLAGKTIEEISAFKGIGKKTLNKIESAFERIFYEKNPDVSQDIITN
ncbi:MAG: DNA-directed RNA polymerase subunit alpha C-terminal domain-containing protein [bacterium]